MCHDRHKALTWVSDPEETQTNDHWGVHPRPDQLSYPSGFVKLTMLTIYIVHTQILESERN